MVDLIEKAITIPDERKEVMEMCLASPSTGDFKPINLSGIQAPKDSFRSPSNSMHMSSSSIFNPAPLQASSIGQKHRPGKAGGGWEDDAEDVYQKEYEHIKPRNYAST